MKQIIIKVSDSKARLWDYYLSQKFGKRKKLETKIRHLILTEFCGLSIRRTE